MHKLKPPPTKVPLLARCFDFWPWADILAPADFALGEAFQKKKLRKFGHMSKLGVPYLPCSLVWTKMNLDKYSSVYPTYLPKKFGHFGPKVCYWILNFDRNIITFFLTSPLLYMKKNPECFYLDILTLILSGRP